MDKFECLKTYYGYDDFREGQEEIIDAVLAGRDALAIMPTGAGKSICFQIPALLSEGITIVVSPLISLMIDQVKSLNQAGIHAAYINSALSEQQIEKALNNAAQGKYQIIYVAPERLLTEQFLWFSGLVDISLLAIDEAHCISQWGQNFRPGYLRILDYIAKLSKRPVIAAFTATATLRVSQDIIQTLELQDPLKITTGYDRQNLFFAVKKPQNKAKELLRCLEEHRGQSGIIYCNTRKNVDEVYAALLKAGYPVVRYHAGLADQERKLSQDRFIFDEDPIMVATNAFGMGIDKSNVRFIIHYNMPKDLESYYQEAGRAGRDGAESECVLYYSAQDVRINEFLIEKQNENTELEEAVSEVILAREKERLKQMTFYCVTHDCLRGYILRYFGEQSPAYCGKCSNCQTEFTEVDVTRIAQCLFGAITECGQRYGVSVMLDMLRGVDNEKTRKYGLMHKSYAGTLAGESTVRLRQVVNELLVMEYLTQTTGDYPVLELSLKARRIAEEETILIKLPKEIRQTRDKLAAGGSRSKSKISAARYDGQGTNLFEQLRALRMELARKQKVPPYVIFSDKTLLEMVSRMPATKETMLEINGMGKVKYEKYGQLFQKVIEEYQ